MQSSERHPLRKAEPGDSVLATRSVFNRTCGRERIDIAFEVPQSSLIRRRLRALITDRDTQPSILRSDGLYRNGTPCDLTELRPRSPVRAASVSGRSTAPIRAPSLSRGRQSATPCKIYVTIISPVPPCCAFVLAYPQLIAHARIAPCTRFYGDSIRCFTSLDDYSSL